MATRSTISIKNSDGTISSIYSHWDGYLEGVGKILKENYNDENLARKILTEGDVSSLASNLYESLFYNRDRGENTKSKLFTNINDENFISFQQEYNYLFEDNIWKVSLYDELQFKLY
jgi:hypothetical protein